MTRRQILVRLALVFLTGTPVLTGFSHEIRASDEKAVESNSAVVPAANKIPQPDSQLDQRNAEELLKTPTIIPDTQLPNSETDAYGSREDEPGFPQEPPKRQSSMLIPTNWKQNPRLIPTQMDARVNVIHASLLDEPAPESVASQKAPQTSRPKARPQPAKGTGKVSRTVYTQPQTPRTVAQPKRPINDPGFIGVFVPIVSVNAPLGVNNKPGQSAPQIATRSMKPNTVEMLSAQTPLKNATPKLRTAPQTVKPTPTKPQTKRAVTIPKLKLDQE